MVLWIWVIRDMNKKQAGAGQEGKYNQQLPKPRPQFPWLLQCTELLQNCIMFAHRDKSLNFCYANTPHSIPSIVALPLYPMILRLLKPSVGYPLVIIAMENPRSKSSINSGLSNHPRLRKRPKKLAGSPIP